MFTTLYEPNLRPYFLLAQYVLSSSFSRLIIRVIKKSVCTWWLQYRSQAHREFLITLYYWRNSTHFLTPCFFHYLTFSCHIKTFHELLNVWCQLQARHMITFSTYLLHLYSAVMCINCLVQQTDTIYVEHQTVSYLIDSNFFYKVETEILHCDEVNLTVHRMEPSIACLLQLWRANFG